MFDEKRVLNRAISIADELLEVTRKTENGWYWETLSLKDGDEMVWEVSESLYSGTGGIVFFFLELCKYTGKDKYFEAVEKGAEWLIHYCKENPREYYAFFTGRMGVSYLMLQIYFLTDDKYYLTQALHIAKKCNNFLDAQYAVNDLLNGISGTLLGLLHLHSVSKEKWILKKIAIFTRHLLDEIKHSGTGLYWDLDYKYIQPLCGFSHGTSGIGYVFLELGYYFKNEAFYRVAHQAFAYENAHFNDKRKNWPDFRKGMLDDESYEEHKTAYLENDFEFFFEPKFMTAWCHGAPGIGLSRVRAYQLLKRKEYKIDVEHAIKHTYRMMENSNIHASYNMCHGRGGNALLFVDAYRQLGDKKYLEYAREIAQQAIKSHKKLGKYIPGYSIEQVDEDSSLFMGKAGVGYFYLQCLGKANNSSILAPYLYNNIESDSSIPDVLTISLKEIQKIIFRKAFPRTMKLVELKFPKELNQIEASNPVKNVANFFSDFINKLSEKGNKDTLERIEDVFTLEKRRLELKGNANPAYLRIRDDFLVKSVEKLFNMDDSEFLKQELRLSNTISFCKTKWNWSLSIPDKWIKNFDIPPNEYKILHYKKMPIISEFTDISDFTLSVFQVFETPKSVNEAIILVSKLMTLDENDKDVRRAIIAQINEGIKGRILVNKFDEKNDS